MKGGKIGKVGKVGKVGRVGKVGKVGKEGIGCESRGCQLSTRFLQQYNKNSERINKQFYCGYLEKV